MEEYKKKSNFGTDVFIRIHPNAVDDSHPPTAILLGWFAAAPKNVAKYSTLYEANGYNTVHLVAPASVVFPFNPRTTSNFLLSILRILHADDRLTRGGLVFHMFSNGGAVMAPHLSKFLSGGAVLKADDEIVVRTIRDAICGVIFDSCPAYLHVSLGAAAITEGLKIPPGFLARCVALAFAFMCWVQRVFFCDLQRVFWTGVQTADYTCPELYVYSTADHLMDAKSLEALIEERRHRFEVRVLRVEDSEHVMIMRRYPDKYVEMVRGVNEWGVNAWRRRNGMKEWSHDSR